MYRGNSYCGGSSDPATETKNPEGIKETLFESSTVQLSHITGVLKGCGAITETFLHCS